MTPKPVSPEMWIGAMSEPGVRRAARFGRKWCTDPLHNLEVMKYWDELYRGFGEEFGTSDQLGTVLLRDGWLGNRHGRGREGLVAAHPRRALVLLQAGPALGA